jgi:hypothetical protein
VYAILTCAPRNIYLLCYLQIIQNDEKNCQIQSAQMARIYVNPTITLAASVSTSAQEGLFRSADFEKFGQPLSTPCDIHVRKPLRHRATDLPLLGRGWVFQERLLSPRILHFGQDELMWGCMEFTSCECGGMEEEHSAFRESWLALKDASHLIHRRLFKKRPLGVMQDLVNPC